MSNASTKEYFNGLVRQSRLKNNFCKQSLMKTIITFHKKWFNKINVKVIPTAANFGKT